MLSVLSALAFLAVVIVALPISRRDITTFEQFERHFGKVTAIV